MRFKVAAHTDVGIRKDTNQDSYCVLQAETENGDVLMATVCDGLGGLESGELASATIVKAFAKWFEEELPLLLPLPTVLQDARYQWSRMIKSQNQTIGEYGPAAPDSPGLHNFRNSAFGRRTLSHRTGGRFPGI